MMKKVIAVFVVALIIMTSMLVSAVAQEPEIAYTYNPNPDERVPLYYEPILSSNLFGEYFNGVRVNVLEHVSDEWVKVQIVTWEGTDGVQMYVESKYLVYGEDGEEIEKTTILYVSAVNSLYLHAVAYGQSIDYGPFGLGEDMELIGIIVPQHFYDQNRMIDRPLNLEEMTLHIKTGDISGFLSSYDIAELRIAD